LLPLPRPMQKTSASHSNAILAQVGLFPSKPWVGENFRDRDPFINISI
jgi:hypothetical protein